MTMQTWRVVIDRNDLNKYCGCVLCNDKRVIIEFQTPVGSPAPKVLLQHMDETPTDEEQKQL
jgi:hypothetical protein